MIGRVSLMCRYVLICIFKSQMKNQTRNKMRFEWYLEKRDTFHVCFGNEFFNILFLFFRN